MAEVPAKSSHDPNSVARLQLLLPWLNGDEWALPAEALAKFLATGSIHVATRELRGLRANKFDTEDLRTALRRLLDGGPTDIALPTLRVRTERRGNQYWRVVATDVHDAVVYDVWRLLGIVRLDRCPAPRSGDARKRCDKWFIVGGARRGRRSEFCSDACRQRAFQRTS